MPAHPKQGIQIGINWRSQHDYRPKFLLSYSFCLLRLLVEEKMIEEVDRLARRFTCYGPAPWFLFSQLTGKNENDLALGVVGFARTWRNEFQQEFGVDFELPAAGRSGVKSGFLLPAEAGSNRVSCCRPKSWWYLSRVQWRPGCLARPGDSRRL